MQTFSALTCLVLLSWCSTCGGASNRDQHHPRPEPRGSPSQDGQVTEQNLQFMLALYRSAAGQDGRPKQRRRFGSNTVQLLRPAASSVRHLAALRDHHYKFTVEYNLDSLPLEQLIRASFVHFRSSPPSTSTSAGQDVRPPRCRAQITTVGGDDQARGPLPRDLVTIEPHDQWTETDITAHVSGHLLRGPGPSQGGRLALAVRYLCTESGAPSWSRGGVRKRIRGRGGEGSEYHLEVPSLLLYLEEEQEVKDWMRSLLAAEEGPAAQQRSPPAPALRRRHRRSKDPKGASPDAKDPSLEALKKSPNSSSSSSPTPSSSSSSLPSVVSVVPGNKRGKAVAPGSRCRLHSFRLSFEDLGWGHYFIAPPVYNPRFCQGDCPRMLHYGYHSPNHAIIQTAIRDLGVGDLPPTACVPYSYMPMSVLVRHKQKVEYRELEDMVAESCTCR